MSTAWNAFPMLDRLFDDVMDDVTGEAFGTTTTQSTDNPAIDVRTNDDQIDLRLRCSGTEEGLARA